MSSLTTAPITSAGLTRLASLLQADIAYASIGTGTGLLNAALTPGQTYTSLSVQAGVPAAGLAAGTALTLVNGTQSQDLVVSTFTPGGTSSIPVQSFAANASYPVGSGLLTTPQASDLQLQNEVYRKPITNVVQGAQPGEVLATAYWAPTDAPGATYLEIGYWAADATTTLGSGTLIARAIYWFPHTSSDSDTAQLDTII